MTSTQPASEGAARASTDAPPPQQEQQLPQLPQKRAADVLLSGIFELCVDDFGEAVLQRADETVDMPIPFHNETYYKAYLASKQRVNDLKKDGVNEDPTREDASSSEDEGKTVCSSNWTESCPGKSSLRNHVPSTRSTSSLSVQRRTTNWMRWGGIKPLSHKEADKILSDPKLSKRVLKSRAAYRDKNKGLGEVKAKCRVVLIGCNDPDIFKVTRDSPTPSRLSEAIVLSVATAGMNREVNGDGGLWRLWLSDAKSAFLQGEQNREERGGPIFMKPPRDPLINDVGAFSAPLYEVLGNAYGLPDAPRVWNQRVRARATGKGFKQHAFDRCLFYFVDSTGRLLALMIVHVGDFMCAYHELFDVSILEQMFTWGSVTIIDEDHPGVYRGKEIELIKENGRFMYKVTQTSFIDGMDSGRLPRGRSKESEKSTPDEWKEFRSVSGSLQWLSSQTRPELGPVVSLSNRGSETTFHDLRRLYETVEYVKSTRKVGITFQDVPFDRSSTLVTFANSSWANNSTSLKSQFGLLVLLTRSQVTAGRSARVCRSTLAAEACASDEGADRAAMANYMLSELLYDEPAFKVGLRLSSLLVTDAKSLYDCVVAENPNLSDKRSLVNIRSIQETVTPQQIHWVPTELMRADALTKLDSALLVEFTKWLLKPLTQLREMRFGQKKNYTSVNLEHSTS